MAAAAVARTASQKLDAEIAALEAENAEREARLKLAQRASFIMAGEREPVQQEETIAPLHARPWINCTTLALWCIFLFPLVALQVGILTATAPAPPPPPPPPPPMHGLLKSIPNLFKIFQR
ncbi:hypothetical protein AB1Y20_004598 [Prymnesium parvum]|uniref:Uncharacterized protein n=1 Tax=Prymnesium parvum TaxID=97485 RepID=A0AB34IZ83_PRYPA